MKILAIGDIVGTRAIDHLQKHLWKLRDRMRIDLVVANGENASDIHGLSASDAAKKAAAQTGLKKGDIYRGLMQKE